VRIGGISIFRLAEGKIAEHWEQLDRLALMQQLGVVPTPEQAPPQA
jgi:predicted ester cyclase